MTTYVGLVTPAGNALVDGTGKWLILAVEPLPLLASAVLVGRGVLSADANVVRAPPPEFTQGKYVPTTWPSASRPWKY
jgi:hypothetical protein